MGKRKGLNVMNKNIAEHYDSLAPFRNRYYNEGKYYYKLLFKEYCYLVPEGKRVLEVGSATGNLLNALRPSYGVGIDISPKMVELARQHYPDLHFHEGEIKDLKIEEKFDYIILSGLIGDLEDIEQFFCDLKKFCHPQTRVIIQYYSRFWQSILKIAEKWDMKMPERLQNWVAVCEPKE